MNQRRADTGTVDAYDLLPGDPVFVWVSQPSNPLPDPVRGREILLSRVASIVTAELHDPDWGMLQWTVRPRDGEDEDKLRRIVREAGDPGGLVALVQGLAEPGQGRWMRLRVHVFDEVHRWPRMTIAVDGRGLDSVRRISGEARLRKPDEARRWLANRLRLPPLPGDSAVRMVALAGPHQPMHAPAPCQLLGNGIAAALSEANGIWWANKVHRQGSAVPGGRRAVLIHIEFELVNMSVEAQLRAQMRAELEQLAAGANDTFLALWQHYHEMENRHALNRLKALGYLSYHGFEYRDDADDVVRVHLHAEDPEREDAVLEHLEAELGAGAEIELECAVALPEVFGGAAGTDADAPAGLLDVASENNEVGVLLDVDRDAGTVDLRLNRRERRVAGVGPSLRQRGLPPAGFLHAAIGGDRRRLQRRQYAFDRLLRGRIPLPQLLTLLQGKLARGRDGKPVSPLSPATRALFKAEPQPAQIQALDAALNTPDIAVIQGPPGTGKTQVIAALQVRGAGMP